MRSTNSPAELPADFGTIDGEDHPDTVIANAATAIERERCAKIAEAHKGAAARRRKDLGQKLHVGMDGYEEIVGEERGEDIAAEMIAREIRKAQ